MFAVANYGYWDLWRLYHKVTFDGANRIIFVNPEVTDLDIKTDVYSAWKEWTSSMSDNAGWVPAVRTIGGDPTVSGQRAGDIYFLQNNWKLYIDLTQVRVTGILFSDDFDSAYYDFNGNIQYPAQVASLVTTAETTSGTSTNAPTTSEISQAVWTYIQRTLTSDAAPSADTVAAAVWDKASSSHTTDGTFGKKLNDIDTNVSEIETKILELWRLAGLDASNVASITDTSITVGGVTITIGQPDSDTTTLTRS
jgi:hypothetical protein